MFNPWSCSLSVEEIERKTQMQIALFPALAHLLQPRNAAQHVIVSPARIRSELNYGDSDWFSGTARQESYDRPVKTVCNPWLTSLRCRNAG